MHGPGVPGDGITNQGAADVVLLEDGGDVVAWVGPIEPDEVCVQLSTSHGHLAHEVVERVLDTATADDVVKVGRTEIALRDALEASGRFGPPKAAGHGMHRTATADVPASPDGYTVRAVAPGEEAARVEVHRAAWLPASLPWHPDHRPEYPPDATSSFTEATYLRVRKTWLYERDRDLVAVAEDGSFAACCIVWFDPHLGVAEIEPLGVVPEHRRRGLAGALCHAALARVAEAGGREVYIAVGPNEAYPHSSQAYAKAGFELRDHVLEYRLTTAS